MASPFDEIRAQRFAFLRAVYDETEGSTDRFLQMNEIGTQLGFGEDLTEKIATYLVNEGLLEWAAMGGVIELTHWGLKEVEEVLGAPERPTDHFLPLMVAENVLQIGTMTNSQVQQGTVGSSQTAGAVDTQALRALIDELRELVSEIDFEAEDKAEIEAEIATVEAQLRSPRPKPQVLRESLASARAVLEGAAGGGLVNAMPQVAQVLERLAQAIASLPL